MLSPEPCTVHGSGSVCRRSLERAWRAPPLPHATGPGRDQVIRPTNKLFPRAVIVWSDIVPRHHWQYMGCQKAAAKVRRKVNATAGKVVKGLGGVTVTHPLIRWDDLSCYRLAVNDPVHLSNKGLHLLCTAWAQAVRELL